MTCYNLLLHLSIYCQFDHILTICWQTDRPIDNDNPEFDFCFKTCIDNQYALHWTPNAYRNMLMRIFTPSLYFQCVFNDFQCVITLLRALSVALYKRFKCFKNFNEFFMDLFRWMMGGALMHVYVWEHIVSLYYRTDWWMFMKLCEDEVLMALLMPYGVLAISVQGRIQGRAKIGHWGSPSSKQFLLYPPQQS